MIRRLFTAASVMSLLLLVAVAAYSYRSYSVAESVEYIFGPTVPSVIHGDMARKDVWLLHQCGRAMLGYSPKRAVVLANEPCVPENKNWIYEPEETGWFADLTVARFRAEHPTAKSFGGIYWGPAVGGWVLLFPDWAVMLITALVPAAWITKRMRSRMKRRAGHCRTCSYDLTGNVSGVCPECGVPAPEEATA